MSLSRTHVNRVQREEIMKKILIALALLFTLDAFSKVQYIQCGLKNQPESTMGVVINLDGIDSTLYITNGFKTVDTVDLVFKKLIKDSETETQEIYRSGEVKIHGKENTLELVTIDKSDIGVATNYMEVNLKILNFNRDLRQELELSCFSSMNEF